VKQVKLVLTGMILSIGVSTAYSSGIFDEAGQYKAQHAAFAAQ
jgi:hypothetical protein